MFILAVVVRQCAVAFALFIACVLAVSDSARQWQWLEPDTVYVTHGNLYDVYFSEPFESQVIFFPDGSLYAFSTHQQYIVGASATWVEAYLKKDKQSVSRARLIIHSHPAPGPFSPSDKVNCRHFRELGFEGEYAVYYPFNRTIIYLEYDCQCQRKDN